MKYSSPFCVCSSTAFRFKCREVDVTANLGYAPCMAAPVSYQSAGSLTEILKSLLVRLLLGLSMKQPGCRE